MANSKTPSSDLEQLFERVARQQLTFKKLAYTLDISDSAVKRLFALYSNNPAEFRKSESNQKLSNRLQQLQLPTTNKAPDNSPDTKPELPFKKPLKVDDICEAMVELGNVYYERYNKIPKSPLYLRKFMLSVAEEYDWEVIDKPANGKHYIKIEGKPISYDAFNKRFNKYLDDNGR